MGESINFKKSSCVLIFSSVMSSESNMVTREWNGLEGSNLNNVSLDVCWQNLSILEDHEYVFPYV